MTTSFKLMLSAAVLAALAAAGASVAVAMRAPWSLAGVTAIAGMVNGHFSPAAPAGRDGTAGAPRAAAQDQAEPDTAPATTDMELHLADVQPGPMVPAAPAAPPAPVDYGRLNGDVRVVADTLERFNRKLLVMIAQARSAQQPPPPPPVESPSAQTDDTSDETEPEP